MKMTITTYTEDDGHEAAAQHLAGPSYALAAHRFREKMVKRLGSDQAPAFQDWAEAVLEDFGDVNAAGDVIGNFCIAAQRRIAPTP